MRLTLAAVAVGLASPVVSQTIVQEYTNYAFYADGHIVQRVDSSGNTQPSLGTYPAKESWPLRLATAFSNNEPEYLQLAEPKNKDFTYGGPYHLHPDYLTLLVSPGAFSPVTFSPGSSVSAANSSSTFPAGATTFGFYTPYGILIWAKDGSPSDLGPPDGSGGELVVASDGWQWVPVQGKDADGVQILYWNQTLHENVVAGKGSGSVGSAYLFAYGDYSPVFY